MCNTKVISFFTFPLLGGMHILDLLNVKYHTSSTLLGCIHHPTLSPGVHHENV